MWPGESNANDVVGPNNGFVTNGVITYNPGEVGLAFHYDGTGGYVQVPASPSLNVGLGAGFTVEGWIKPGDLVSQRPLFEWQYDGVQVGPHFWISSGGAGRLYANVTDTSGNSHVFFSAGGILTSNYQHVALTYNKTTGQAFIYRNGAQVASANLGIFTPRTTNNVLLGARTYLGGALQYDYVGDLDEMSLYKRALSQAEIQSIYAVGSAGKFAPLPTVQSYLDTDQDGLPDFWETTFGQNPTNADSYLQTTNANFIGYSDLEEYLAWLAGPHALTVTNTSVGVDLMPIFGKTGNLSFTVTNAVNGTVYLTNVLGSVTNTGPWSNSIVVFTPTNTSLAFSGYAAFDVYVTNTDTVAYFGPVTVSVLVSAVPITYTSTNTIPPVFLLTNGPPV